MVCWCNLTTWFQTQSKLTGSKMTKNIIWSPKSSKHVPQIAFCHLVPTSHTYAWKQVYFQAQRKWLDDRLWCECQVTHISLERVNFSAKNWWFSIAIHPLKDENRFDITAFLRMSLIVLYLLEKTDKLCICYVVWQTEGLQSVWSRRDEGSEQGMPQYGGSAALNIYLSWWMYSNTFSRACKTSVCHFLMHIVYIIRRYPE